MNEIATPIQTATILVSAGSVLLIVMRLRRLVLDIEERLMSIDTVVARDVGRNSTAR